MINDISTEVSFFISIPFVSKPGGYECSATVITDKNTFRLYLPSFRKQSMERRAEVIQNVIIVFVSNTATAEHFHAT